MKYLLHSITVCLVILVGSLLAKPAVAQNCIQPLIIATASPDGSDQHGASLWTWAPQDRTFKKIVDMRFDGRRFAVSPDERWIAYSAYAELAADDTQHSSVAESPIPTDIWLVDVDKRTQQRITSQPSTATLQELYQRGMVRSQLTWSPDGSSLIWLSEQLADPQEYTLVVHEIATHKTTTIASHLKLNAPDIFDLLWSQTGIALIDKTYDGEDQVIRVYEQRQQRHLLTMQTTHKLPLFWGQYRDNVFLVLEESRGVDFALDINSGVLRKIDSDAAYRSTSADSDFKIHEGYGSIVLSGPNGARREAQMVTLSPDGRWAAYLCYVSDLGCIPADHPHFALLSNDGTAENIITPGAVVWLGWGATRGYVSALSDQ